MSRLDSIDLDTLYAPPSDAIQRAVLPHLVPFHEAYLAVASFFCLASGRANGLDASPRGGPPGFVKVLDQGHVAFADWPGNNRIETLRNLCEDDRLALLFLFPGLDVFMRINGHGRISTEPDLLAKLTERERAPKTGIVVAIDEVLFHCGKAITRARLWSEAGRVDRASVPSIGAMKVGLTGGATADIDAVDRHYRESVQRDLY